MSDKEDTRKRRVFSPEEDVNLSTLVSRYGVHQWKLIASFLPGRTARQCRERWKTFLAPGHTNRPWTQEEDILLFKLHNEFGSKWSQMAHYFPGRSDYNIKNRWQKIHRFPPITRQRQPLPEPDIREDTCDNDDLDNLTVDDLLYWTF